MAYSEIWWLIEDMVADSEIWWLIEEMVAYSEIWWLIRRYGGLFRDMADV